MATSAELHQLNGPNGAMDITADMGIPRYNRRLSEKILAAFNRACAVGEIEIASRLPEVLARLDSDQAQDVGWRRDGTIALSQADLWIEFVEARNDYRAICDKTGIESGAVETSLDAMKDTYRRWSAV